MKKMHISSFFSNAKTRFWLLLGSVIFLTIGFILFGGWVVFLKPFADMQPIYTLKLNMAIIGLIFLYFTLISMMPFFFFSMHDMMKDKPGKHDN